MLQCDVQQPVDRWEPLVIAFPIVNTFPFVLGLSILILYWGREPQNKQGLGPTIIEILPLTEFKET